MLKPITSTTKKKNGSNKCIFHNIFSKVKNRTVLHREHNGILTNEFAKTENIFGVTLGAVLYIQVEKFAT